MLTISILDHVAMTDVLQRRNANRSHLHLNSLILTEENNSSIEVLNLLKILVGLTLNAMIYMIGL